MTRVASSASRISGTSATPSGPAQESAFTLGAILTLGIGIGGSMPSSSLINAVPLAPSLGSGRYSRGLVVRGRIEVRILKARSLIVDARGRLTFSRHWWLWTTSARSSRTTASFSRVGAVEPPLLTSWARTPSSATFTSGPDRPGRPKVAPQLRLLVARFGGDDAPSVAVRSPQERAMSSATPRRSSSSTMTSACGCAAAFTVGDPTGGDD